MDFSNDIKIYQINLNFFEFAGFSNDSKKVISHIIEYHKQNFNTAYEVHRSTTEFANPPCSYTLHTFNESEQQSTWKQFFPKELIGDKDFAVKSMSFTLFIAIEQKLFAVIGGKGMSMIKRFINPSFGLDVYEKVAEPAVDVVYSHMSRAVSGNLTSEQKTFRNNQKLQDTLSIGTIPKKYFLVLRNDLKDSIFDFIDFGDAENIYLEIGSALRIKWKISFPQLQELIVKLNDILNVQGGSSLSRFDKIQDEYFIDANLKPALLDQLRQDMVRLSTPGSNLNMLLDYDFVHPSKLMLFYECDEYKAFLKGAKTPFFETRDRTVLYSSILKHFYTIVDPNNPIAFNRIILGTRIRGYVGEHKKTEAMFINHLTCELTTTARPYFLIDDQWYQVKGQFLKFIEEQCLALLKKNLVTPNPLDLQWPQGLREGDYNLLYLQRPGYFILDTILSQNVELCDILYETTDALYLIHVKDGFDAKIRDLTNQALMSANRLWNDLKSDLHFLKEIYTNYANSGNFVTNLSWDEFLLKFTTKEVIIVLAFSSNLRNKTVLNNIDEHRSNIAKFSLVMSFKDIQTNNFPLKAIEISKL